MLEAVHPLRVNDAMISCPKALGPDSSVAEARSFFAGDHVQLLSVRPVWE